MRGTMVGAALLAGVAAGCASQPTTVASVSSRPVAKTAAAPATPTTPAATPQPKHTSTAVAVPGCLGPEVEPDWWTPNCGDAGYQIELIWDSWSATSATAHGRVTTRFTLGTVWSVHVVFDRPRAVAGYDGRPLFSRLVVHYDSGHGPDGTASEVMNLEDVWRNAILIASEPIDPCTTGPDGFSNCAPEIPEPDVTSTG